MLKMYFKLNRFSLMFDSVIIINLHLLVHSLVVRTLKCDNGPAMLSVGVRIFIAEKGPMIRVENVSWEHS